ncbi:MAG: phosphosulfolactate synthase [Marinilabiliales bacterium]|nr:MAG: phosphosulfolactate synthase [Marinilabiliales bacterium]
MNYKMKHVPDRSEKPRKKGITMVMDKGLSPRQADDLVQVAGHLIDFVKLGFGTSAISGKLEEKIAVYTNAGIDTYFGGTLFEAFLIRSGLDEYRKLMKKFKISTVEISDGSMDIDHDAKCDYIKTFARDFKVLSEVGSKRADVNIRPNEWVTQMVTELEAGAQYVIGEARESGTIGIFNQSGSAKKNLIHKITGSMPKDKIIWEAPQKNQQVYFIKEFGFDVNLGNIAPDEVIALETLRLGLRGDTFFHFLPNEMKQFDQK